MYVQVNMRITELKNTTTNRHQNPGFESYLDKKLFFFPGISM